MRVMRKLLLLATAGAVFLAAACTPEEAAAWAKKVQDKTAQVCGYLPDVPPLVAVFNKDAGETVLNVTQVATAICNQVLPQKSAAVRTFGKSRGVPAAFTIKGVLITGHFVR